MIAPGKIVTQDRDLYRVDGYLVAPEVIPADTNVPFELEMQCFNLRSWQKVVHADDSLCDPAEDPDDTFNAGLSTARLKQPPGPLLKSATTPTKNSASTSALI